jgi:Holliday junction DNA helicase RuvA
LIRRLEGTLVLRDAESVVVSCHGVGYLAEIPANTPLPPVGGRVELWTHLRVREDALDLFGFAKLEELRLFEAMLKVKRLPARAALAIIAHCGIEGFQKALGDGDVDSLTRVPGIGRKSAQQILLEMRGKIEFDALPSAGGGAVKDDATLALIELGYSEAEARERVAAIRKADPSVTDPAEIVRMALARGRR